MLDTIGGLRRAWGIDVSAWQDILNYRALKQAGMSFVIVKTSMGFGDDPRAQTHIDTARAAGLTVGVYHWGDETASVSSQRDRFLGWLTRVQPSFAASDNEQWWRSWDLYYKMIAGQLSGSLVPAFTSSQINQFYRDFMAQVSVGAPRMRLLNYTANWFMYYSPEMRGWLDLYDLWLAAYVWSKSPSATSIYFKDWVEFYACLDGLTSPRLPQGATKWKFWQFTSTRRLPGFGELDLDVFNGTIDELNTWAGTVAPPPPPPTMDPVWYTVRAGVLKLNIGPGANYPAAPWREWLYYGARRIVSKIENNYGQIGPNRWMSLAWCRADKV